MKPKLAYILKLVRDRGWSGSELARKMGVSRSEANRFLNGQRKGGNKVISGLLEAFPEETVETLFILPSMYPNVNNINNKSACGKQFSIETVSIPPKTDKSLFLKPVKHPSCRQTVCKIDENTGTIEIAEGANVTTLLVLPGPIEVRHTTRPSLADTR